MKNRVNQSLLFSTSSGILEGCSKRVIYVPKCDSHLQRHNPFRGWENSLGFLIMNTAQNVDPLWESELVRTLLAWSNRCPTHNNWYIYHVRSRLTQPRDYIRIVLDFHVFPGFTLFLGNVLFSNWQECDFSHICAFRASNLQGTRDFSLYPSLQCVPLPIPLPSPLRWISCHQRIT